MKILVAFLITFTVLSGHAMSLKTHNVVLVTIDGVRWQEVFRGVDKQLVEHQQYTKNAAALHNTFWSDDVHKRREKLMPFLWNNVASHGVLIGNRDRGSFMDVSNEWWFSYPGYNEILSGFADPAIDSNDKFYNPNVTVLEWVDQQPGFSGKVAAFASWDVFPYIINTQRARNVTVNAGFDIARGELSGYEKWLNQLQLDIPSPWSSVRLDAFTHYYAIEHINKAKPRLLYVAYGEPDDFAHDGRYDHYITSIHRIDRFINHLWASLQKDPFYRDSTTLIITTDHGRGDQPLATWTKHASKKAMAASQSADAADFKHGIVGSNHIWLAALGPDTPAEGLVTRQQPWSQHQLAATVARLLNLDFNQYQPKAGQPISAVFERMPHPQPPTSQQK